MTSLRNIPTPAMAGFCRVHRPLAA